MTFPMNSQNKRESKKDILKEDGMFKYLTKEEFIDKEHPEDESLEFIEEEKWYRDAFIESTEKYGDAYFPQLWAPNSDGIGGEAVEDPMVIYLCLSMNVAGGTSVEYFSLNLWDVLEDWFDDFRCDDGKTKVGNTGAKYLRKLKYSLETMASRIEEFIIESYDSQFDDSL